MGFSFTSSLHLFYPRSFIEVSGSESSDGLRFCLVIVLLISPWVVEEFWFLVTRLWLLFPASISIQFYRSSTRQCHQHLSQPLVRKLYLSVSFQAVSLTPVIYHALSNLVSAILREPLVLLLGLELGQLWLSPCSAFHHNSPRKRKLTAFAEVYFKLDRPEGQPLIHHLLARRSGESYLTCLNFRFFQLEMIILHKIDGIKSEIVPGTQ